ncbi:DUF397 domain-containing protein [Streptomyces sp. NPDC002209]|uniref:DUF397 domain-containing protein n=1 Tax=Streptomyces sp. NPDC002209 TaxID=3364638 RepID=UPI0036C60C34
MSEPLTREELDALDLSDAKWGSDTSVLEGEGMEVAYLKGGAVAMRKANEPSSVLRYTKGEWTAFVLGARDGEFDLG